MKKIALAQVKDNFSKYLVQAEREQIVITKHGKPAGVLIGFEDEDDWFDFRLENDPRFLRKVEKSRASIRAGRGVSWEEVKAEDDQRASASAARPVRAGSRARH